MSPKYYLLDKFGVIKDQNLFARKLLLKRLPDKGKTEEDKDLLHNRV